MHEGPLPSTSSVLPVGKSDRNVGVMYRSLQRAWGQVTGSYAAVASMSGGLTVFRLPGMARVWACGNAADGPALLIAGAPSAGTYKYWLVYDKYGQVLRWRAACLGINGTSMVCMSGAGSMLFSLGIAVLHMGQPCS